MTNINLLILVVIIIGGLIYYSKYMDMKMDSEYVDIKRRDKIKLQKAERLIAIKEQELIERMNREREGSPESKRLKQLQSDYHAIENKDSTSARIIEDKIKKLEASLIRKRNELDSELLVSHVIRNGLDSVTNSLDNRIGQLYSAKSMMRTNYLTGETEIQDLKYDMNKVNAVLMNSHNPIR